MPIAVTCDCGKALRLKDELAGKRVRCPACKEPLAVPDAEEELEEALPADDEPRVRSRREEDERPRRARLQADDDEDDRPRRRRDEDDEEDDRPRRRKKRLQETSSGGGFGSAGVLGGIGLIVLGVGLFVGLLLAGWIWPYSLVIAAAGVVSIVRSLVTGE